MALNTDQDKVSDDDEVTYMTDSTDKSSDNPVHHPYHPPLKLRQRDRGDNQSDLLGPAVDSSFKPRCQRCKKRGQGCDRQRPCTRCKDAGLGADQCLGEDGGNGRKTQSTKNVFVKAGVQDRVAR